MKSFSEGVAKNECDHFGQGTLKLAVFQEWIYRINWCLHADTNSRKLKVPSMIFE